MKKRELLKRIEKLEQQIETIQSEHYSLETRHVRLTTRVAGLELRKSFEEPALQPRRPSESAACACNKAILTAGPSFKAKLQADLANLAWADNKALWGYGEIKRKPCGTGWSVSLGGTHIGCWAVDDPALGANWRMDGQPSMTVTATNEQNAPLAAAATQAVNFALRDKPASRADKEDLYRDGLACGLSSEAAWERAKMGVEAWNAKERNPQ